MGAIAKFGQFQIAHKIWGELNAWNGTYIDLAAKTGLFALLDRSRYVIHIKNSCKCQTTMWSAMAQRDMYKFHVVV